MSEYQSFAVFGNPIAHSKSPRIHTLFAEQSGILLNYERLQAPVDEFELYLHAYFQSGAAGANITAPFKERACVVVDSLSQRAAEACAVNVVKKMADGTLFGDNTDGIGLLSDLQQNGLIQPGDRVLLVGAGGAARGVIQPLLAHGCSLIVTNRTLDKAEMLASHFSEQGSIRALPQSSLASEMFDLIINATSSGVYGNIPDLPPSLINAHVRCYDMFYLPEPTPFLQWCTQQGAEKCVDGLGMLVWQAAHAFNLWHGVMPQTEPVIRQLKLEFMS
ncbi:shikimate dehydrogenase [Musicola keenii]|uniref:shikimate dehydrogenase n=1 Tax=Musicola keenii TaxID=2884250 RepID=UPI00177ED4DC